MGYLAAKDLGKIGVQTTNYLIEGIVDSPKGAINPTSNYGIINLMSYKLSTNMGKNINAEPNIAGNITRIGMGSSNPTPITLSIKLNRRPTLTEIDSIKYLSAWARNRTVVVLFYMPNSTNTTLSYGQEPDFYHSQLRTLYDVVWDRNVGTNAYSSSTYGASRFNTGLTINSSPYNACAVPCVFNNIVINSEASTYSVDVSLEGYVLENEEQ